jgi:hypothetical protein
VDAPELFAHESRLAPQTAKLLHYRHWTQMQVLPTLIRFARKPPREKLQAVRNRVVEMDWYWKLHKPGNDRTAYVIGLFGTGRWYITEMMLQNMEKRAKYFRYEIRVHSGPTSLIYSGHATIKYASSMQTLPAVTSRILETVRSRFADLIFVYRHPLDSLLTNWVWWRRYIRDIGVKSTYISDFYKNTDDLCADLERNFLEFKAFAEGDPDFFAALPDTRFLSFPEFVEETELYLQSATLTLRLEDCMIDPFKEFSKLVEVMSVDLDLSRLRLDSPITKPYRYLAIREKVPRFRSFINELNEDTKRRIEKIGYQL